MLWLSRPPYLRWIAIALAVAAAVWIEVRPVSTEQHPFADRDHAVGDPLSVRWEDVPAGVLEPVEPIGHAARPLRAGEPLLVSDVTDRPPAAPDGWWVVELELPFDAVVGAEIQLVTLPTPGVAPVTPIAGVVTSVRIADGTFGSGRPVGAVAVPPERAAEAAVAIAEDRISVLVRAPHRR